MTIACRFCSAPLHEVVADLGMLPLSNSYVRVDEALEPESRYPFIACVCQECLLVQAEAVETPQKIFGDYAYFSSFSDSWLERAQRFCRSSIDRFSLGRRSRVIEVGSNDGYLLQYFAAAGIPVSGIDPAANIAAVAEQKGVPTKVCFFSSDTARGLDERADLLIANNVLAHVPDLNDFVEGLKLALADEGTLTVEFPHVLQLLAKRQFDTMYHEHLSYFSLLTIKRIFAAHGLAIVDVEELPVHGGSLRVYARRSGDASPAVEALLTKELEFGLDRVETYRKFSDDIQSLKSEILSFLRSARDAGRSVAGYGAPAKASTLLTYCGIGPDLLEYTVDRSPHKQGRFVPGGRIPIRSPEELRRRRPDLVVILAWNLRDEIVSEMADVREWGGRFVIPVPKVEVIG